MGKTMAEHLIEKGRKKGRKEGETKALQRMLLRQLGERFGELPAETVAVVKATKDIEQLDTWLVRFAKANTLEEVGIG